ncbi:MAG: signal peptidase II [Bacteroidia bacterium]|nr:signal peptidase II [Bacteroidia bacterium]
MKVQLSKLTRLALILGIVMLNVGCDQISKSIVRDRVDEYEQIELIGQHFILTKVENTGAFLSAGSNLSPVLRQLVLIVLPGIVMFLLLGMVAFRDKIENAVILFMCFMIGGGIGNLLDRIAYGSVTDFLHIDLGLVRTGVFNMADVSIMIGGIGILIYSWRQKNLQKTEPQAEQKAEDTTGEL